YQGGHKGGSGGGYQGGNKGGSGGGYQGGNKGGSGGGYQGGHKGGSGGGYRSGNQGGSGGEYQGGSHGGSGGGYRSGNQGGSGGGYRSGTQGGSQGGSGSGPGTSRGRPPYPRSGPGGPRRGPGGPRSGPSGPRPSRLQPRIVHEDADLIVIDKPAGLVTAHPNERFSAFTFVKAHVKERDARERIWVVHRLDRDVSGLTVFAKSTRAYKWLKEDLQARRVTRQYLALVDGPMQGDGTIQSFLREERDGVVEVDAHAVDTVREDTKLAVTHYMVEASTETRSLLRVRLETGRKHQIRVQLAGRGHPVVGDLRYGGPKHSSRRCALHASVLSFKHPGTGEQVRFQSAPPPWFYTEVGREAPMVRTSTPPRPVPHQRLDTSWEHVASWYDDLIEERRSDHHEDVIIPGTTRLVEPAPGMSILDVACGEGALCRHFATLGAKVTGLDACA
ncbi:MAG: hypothetical protein KDA28_17755, partial [Phycisphaerales bacterium]|nr:hypothetical protein [Phycisphaerales bacterium]